MEVNEGEVVERFTWPHTRAAWFRLTDNWRRLWAQTFLSWALNAHAEEVIDTVQAALSPNGAKG